MSVPEPSPAYRVDWRANKTGTWAHAVVTQIHPDVEAAILADLNGGPYTPDDLQRMVEDCQKRNKLVRMERLGDKRCESCLYLLAELNDGRRTAARLWAIRQLWSAIETLAEHAPIGAPVAPGLDRG